MQVQAGHREKHAKRQDRGEATRRHGLPHTCNGFGINSRTHAPGYTNPADFPKLPLTQLRVWETFCTNVREIAAQKWV